MNPQLTDVESGAGLFPQTLTDDELLMMLDAERQAAEDTRVRADRLQQEALRRMRERGATSIPSKWCVCEVKETVEYDQSRLVQLRERPAFEGWDAAWVEEHLETRVIPGRFDVRKVGALARKVGYEAQRIVEEARWVKSTALQFERKKL